MTRTSRPVAEDTLVKQAIVDAILDRAIDDATGASEPPLLRYRKQDPTSRFWLGLLAAEAEVQPEQDQEAAQQAHVSVDLTERFRPASQGFSFKTDRLPMSLDIEVQFSVWVAIHPTYDEQRHRTLGDEPETHEDGGNDDPVELAKTRMKVPVGPVHFRMTLDPEDADSLEPRHGGRAEIAAAIRDAFRNLPEGTQLHRPLRQPGGVRPRPSDLRTPETWSAWESENLADEARPDFIVEVDADVRRTGTKADTHEVLLTVVNRSPGSDNQFVDRDRTRNFASWACDNNIYEVQLTATPDVPLIAYELEQIPDNYRYDRTLGALGWNSAVVRDGNTLSTAHVARAATERIYPRTRDTDPDTDVDVTFDTLARDPLPALEALVEAAQEWVEDNWSDSALDALASERGWDRATRHRAQQDAAEAREEIEWVRAGLEMLHHDSRALEAFRLMNKTMKRSARGRYDAWRPFQLAFILGCIPGVLDPTRHPEVDILWFPTGGGKTEAYLGLNAFYLFYRRLEGFVGGVHTWARFPLRLLSLQQTQRFADSVLVAEIVRREELPHLPGDPFGVGYFVGGGNTPNEIRLPDDRYYRGWDPEERAEECRVLERCPGCGERPVVQFDTADHTMEHRCNTATCPLRGRLPVYVVDDDIERRVPSVIVGTVDKLTKISWSAGFRHFFGLAYGRCPIHGLSKEYGRCRLYECDERLQPLPDKLAGLGLEIQDEMHLLSEALGSLDGNYETLFQAINGELNGRQIKVIGATATIEGYREQVDHLYRKEPRRFPLPGPRKTESFWSFENPGDPLRTYAAALPRGKTMLDAAWSITSSHRRFLEDGLENAGELADRLGVEAEPDQVERVLRELYWVFTTYALRRVDLTRYRRDMTEDPVLFPEETWGEITSAVQFADIRDTLDRLENPDGDGDIRVVGATAAISHGVDVDRLNVMCTMGMPNQVAEFIQATARVGRTHPGLVFCLINPYRRRDVSHFRYFPKWAEYLDRLVERVPVNREALPVLDLVLPGGFMAWIRQIDEPSWQNSGTSRDRRKKLWKAREVAKAINDGFLDETTMRQRLERSFAIPCGDPAFDLHRTYIQRFVDKLFLDITTSSGDDDLPAVLRAADYPIPRSLRDVEKTVPIKGER